MEVPVTLSGKMSTKDSLECLLMDFGVVDNSLQVQLKFNALKNQPSELFQDLLLSKSLLKVGIVSMVTERKLSSSCVTCHKASDEKGKQISVVLDISSAEYKCPGSCEGDDKAGLNKQKLEEKEAKPEKVPSEHDSSSDVQLVNSKAATPSKVGSSSKTEPLSKAKPTTSKESDSSPSDKKLVPSKDGTSPSKVGSSSKIEPLSKTKPATSKEPDSSSSDKKLVPSKASTPSKVGSLPKTEPLSTTKAATSRPERSLRVSLSRIESLSKAKSSSAATEIASSKTKIVSSKSDMVSSKANSSASKAEISSAKDTSSSSKAKSSSKAESSSSTAESSPIKSPPSQASVDLSTRKSSRIQARTSIVHKKAIFSKTLKDPDEPGNETKDEDKDIEEDLEMLVDEEYEPPDDTDNDEDMELDDEENLHCDHCDKNFTSRHNFQTHMKSHCIKPSPKTLSSKDKSKKNQISTCRLCGKVFSKQRLLARHIHTHSSEYKYSCSHCGKRFSLENYLKKHLKRHKEAEDKQNMAGSPRNYRLKCKLCDQKFSHLVLLSTHMKTHASYKIYSCKECNISFTNEAQAKLHMEVHPTGMIESDSVGTVKTEPIERPGYNCPVCDMNHITRAHLRKHFEEDHTEEERTNVPKTSLEWLKSPSRRRRGRRDRDRKKAKKIKENGSGSESDSSPNEEDDHSGDDGLEDGETSTPTSTGGKNTCKLCNKSFRSYWHIKKHMRTHGEKPFQCKVCDESFQKLTEYLAHIKTHNCSLCSLKFPTPEVLEAHVLSHKVSCKSCKEVFSLGDLKEHMKSHDTDKKETDKEKRKTEKSKSQAEKSNSLQDDSKGESIEGETLNNAENSDNVSSTEKDDTRNKSSVKPVVQHECRICSKTFSRPALLAHHMETHMSENKYECYRCDKSFTVEGYLRKHLKRHAWRDIQEAKYGADVHPPVVFARKKRKPKPKIPEEQKQYVCKFCNLRYRQKSGLYHHNQRVHSVKEAEGSFQCHLCGEVFSCQKNVDKHVESNCKFTETHKQKCEQCGKVLANSVALEQHMKHHNISERNCMCEVCGKCFLKESSLKSHMFCHNGQKSHVCDICGRKYQHVWHLKNHRKIHTGEDLHQCPYCDDWFVNLSYLNNQHRRKYCKGKKTVPCDQCHFLFYDNKELVRHCRYHIGEFPWLCEDCGAAFPMKANLEDHRKRHMLGGKFKCVHCDRLFKHKKDWRKHEERHNSEKGLGRMILSVEKKPKKEPVEFETEEIQQATFVIADSNSGSQFVGDESMLSVESGQTIVVRGEEIITTEALSAYSDNQVTTQSIIVLPEGIGEGQNINITEDGQVLMVAMDPESKL